jgi:hypothetical protein
MINELSEKLQELLNEETKKLSIESGFVKRKSKLTGDKFAKGLIFGWQRNPDSSLNQLSRMISTFDVTISEQGLHKRFNIQSAHFLENLLNKAASIFTSTNEIDTGLLAKFKELKIYDSTLITLPYELIEEWTGSGNRFGSKANSTLKISSCLSLKTGSLKIVLEDGFVNDRSSSLITSETIQEGGLYIKDLGYYSMEHFQHIHEQGGYFASRFKIHNKIYSYCGQQIDIARIMKDKNILDKDVLIGEKKLKCRLLVIRLPEELKEERIQKLIKDSIRKQKPVSERKLALSEFNIFITNLSDDILSFKEVLILMKSRWQIELLFKLWKSYAKIDKSKSNKPYMILTELYAKMIGALISHQVMIIGLWKFIDRSLFKAIKVLQDNVSILAYSFTKDKEAINQAIYFISSNIKQCRIDKRKESPPTFELLAGLKDLTYA